MFCAVLESLQLSYVDTEQVVTLPVLLGILGVDAGTFTPKKSLARNLFMAYVFCCSQLTQQGCPRCVVEELPQSS